MADEREGYGSIGSSRSEDPNTRTGFGSGSSGSARGGFGSSPAETRPGGFGASGDIDESGFERGSDFGTLSSDERAASGPDEHSEKSGRSRIADQLQRVGGRIEERARHLEDAGGVQRRAGRVVLRAGEALDSSADYIRTHEVNEMRDDLESAIRERPLLSVGIAVGAGFLLARLMRD